MIIWGCLGGLGDDSIHYQGMERPSRSTTIVFLCLSIFLLVGGQGTGPIYVWYFWYRIDTCGIRPVGVWHLWCWASKFRYMWYMTSTCDTGPVDVWYLWYRTGPCGTRLVHVIQGQLVAGTCGTESVDFLYMWYTASTCSIWLERVV